MSTPELETWYQGKAFTATLPPEEIVKEFHGPAAKAEAEAWYESTRRYPDPPLDSAYLYRCLGAERTLLQSWSDSYGRDYGNGEDDEDYEDYTSDDDEGY